MFDALLIVAVYLVLQMCFVWVLYRVSGNPSIVDLFWPIGLMVSGLIYLFFSGITSRTLTLAILLTIWSLRLAGYLWCTRLRFAHIDKRYIAISNQSTLNQSLGFFLNFQLQGLLIFTISFIFFFIAKSQANTLSSLDVVATITILLGIIGESIADLQLQRFKRNHPGKVCDIGFWNYSRHPNYFFDWLTWCGFTLFALQSTGGYVSLISLAVLYVIFTRITGPMTERGSIQSRGAAYLEYQARTSMFMPWFKRS